MPENTNEQNSTPEGGSPPESAPEELTSQAAEPADSDAAAAAPEPQPEAWRPALNEALGAIAQSLTERLEKIERSLAMSRMRDRAPAQPQSAPRSDDLDKFAQLIENPLFWEQNGGDPRFLRYLQERFRSYEDRYSKLENELKSFTSSMRERELGEKIASEFDARTEQAIKAANLQLSPRARTALEKVIGYEALCLSDPRKVDINRIVKEFAESIGELKAEADAKKQAAAAAAAAKPAIPGGGAPAKPGATKRTYKSMDDAANDFRELARRALAGDETE